MTHEPVHANLKISLGLGPSQRRTGPVPRASRFIGGDLAANVISDDLFFFAYSKLMLPGPDLEEGLVGCSPGASAVDSSDFFFFVAYSKLILF